MAAAVAAKNKIDALTSKNRRRPGKVALIFFLEFFKSGWLLEGVIHYGGGSPLFIEPFPEILPYTSLEESLSDGFQIQSR